MFNAKNLGKRIEKNQPCLILNHSIYSSNSGHKPLQRNFKSRQKSGLLTIAYCSILTRTFFLPW